MILSEKLRTKFMSNWSEEIKAADSFLDFLDISENTADKIYQYATDYYKSGIADGPKDKDMYFNRIAELTNIKRLINQMDVNKTSCYFASVECVTFVFSRNKNTLVENMNKMLYVNGWLPIHKTTLRYPSKRIYCVMYFTNYISPITPTLN